MNAISHTLIRETLLERIQSGEWELGELIPNEEELAEEFGCARTTVNRALRALAEEGIVIRKRKGGTRVCELPKREAKFEIPIVRQQVEATGAVYRHKIVCRESKKPPISVSTRLHLGGDEKALYLEALHLADERPFAFEMRWVNPAAVPHIEEEKFDTISVNEWLIKSVPFSSGDVSFSAVNADCDIADALDVTEGSALFLVDRTTWYDQTFITTLKLYYNQGFKFYSKL